MCVPAAALLPDAYGYGQSCAAYDQHGRACGGLVVTLSPGNPRLLAGTYLGLEAWAGYAVSARVGSPRGWAEGGC